MTAPASAGNWRLLRESSDGVIAVRDTRRFGGTERPWSVIYVPPGHITHYLEQPLADATVAEWSFLTRSVSVQKGQP